MRVPSRSITTWILAAFFSAAVGLGEGWHFVPGNGHLVEVPGGSCVCVGITLPRAALLDQGDVPTVDSGRQRAVPVEDEDDCPICRISGQGQLQAEAVDFASAISGGRERAVVADSAFCEHVISPFNARGPPCV